MENLIEDGVTDMLLKKRAEAEKELLKVKTKYRKEIKRGVTVAKNHMAECAQYSIPSVTQARLPVLQKIVRKFDEAIIRAKKGNYGVCITCGEQIPVERLMSVPFTGQCVPCKEKTNSMVFV